MTRRKPFFWHKYHQDKLIEDFTRYTRKHAEILHHYYEQSIEIDICISLALSALVRASRKYNPLRGEFEPYLKRAIKNAFISHLTENKKGPD